MRTFTSNQSSCALPVQLFVLLFSTFSFVHTYSQCFADRHNTDLAAGWLSCSKSSNPNPNRSQGHWIMYELDERQTVSSMKIWNINHPDHLNSGVRTLEIDYLAGDGVWINHSVHRAERADASGFYQGEKLELPEEFVTDKILLNYTENFGGGCMGLAEVRIGLINKTTSTFDISKDHFDVLISPNPFVTLTEVTVNRLQENRLIYEIINSLGQKLSSNEVTTRNGAATFQVDGSHLNSGQYYLKLIDGNRISSRKLSVLSK